MNFEVVVIEKNDKEVLVELLEFKSICIDGRKLINYPRRNIKTMSFLKLIKEPDSAKIFAGLLAYPRIKGVILKSEVPFHQPLEFVIIFMLLRSRSITHSRIC